MSSIIINGREIELLEPDYPDFFEPKPLSPKTKSNILFADINGNIHIHFQEIHRKPLLKRRSNIIIGNIPSILGKRKLVDAFDQEIYKDKERYGQDISHDFFKDHVGHDVYPNTDDSTSLNHPISWNDYVSEMRIKRPDLDPQGILDWCNQYLASKNKI